MTIDDEIVVEGIKFGGGELLFKVGFDGVEDGEFFTYPFFVFFFNH